MDLETTIKDYWNELEKPESGPTQELDTIQTAIAKAKEILANKGYGNKSNHQLKVAALALSVCRRGKKGSRRKSTKDSITVSKFATEIGLATSRTALYEWITVYERSAVFIDPDNPENVPYSQARKALVDPNACLSSQRGFKLGYLERRLMEELDRSEDLETRSISEYSEFYFGFTERFATWLKSQKLSPTTEGVKKRLKEEIQKILDDL
jgi:hypothetical protein